MVKKLLIFITVLIFLFAVQPAQAQNIGGQSATLASTLTGVNNTVSGKSARDLRIKRYVIRKVLAQYNSPMVDSVDAFIEACEQYDFDCYFLPAVAGVESTYGKQIYPNSQNAFGWGRGLIMFDTWDEGILTVGSKLQTNYIDRGAVTIEQIGSIYCEGDTWAGKVNTIMGRFKKEEAKMQLFFALNTVEL